MEAEAALIGTDGAVELDAVAEVRLDLAPVVHPGYPEREDAVGLDHPFDDLRLLEFGMLVVHLFDGFEDFLHGLKVLFLKRILRLELRHDVLCSHDGNGLVRFLIMKLSYHVVKKYTNVTNNNRFANRFLRICLIFAA